MGAIGVIGGSGLYRMAGLEGPREQTVSTPFGDPSDRYLLGRLGGRDLVFLSRHGRGHRLSPSEINFRANIYGFKALGVERLVSISAVGSMREELRPLDVVVPDQFIDWTRRRPGSFFDGGIVAHVSLADPVCPVVSAALVTAAGPAGTRVHRGGTYLCIEGPQFSTRAESRLYRSWGIDVIGMTNAQEVRLAREAEICYATLAMVTDYDCWRDDGEPVSVDEVVERLNQNARAAQGIIERAVRDIPRDRTCRCAAALQSSILTDRSRIPRHVADRLRLLAGRYLD
ncbi:MAG: S-methyl-5'-thioadenosine phosphorylase [Acidobacteriota bacterium]